MSQLACASVSNTGSYSVVHQGYASAEKEDLTSDLIARFRTKPVLSQKCAILDVLRQLADSNLDGAGDFPTAFMKEYSPEQVNGISKIGTRDQSRDKANLRDASTLPGVSAASGTAKRREIEVAAPDSNNIPSIGMAKLYISCPTEAALLRDLPFTLQGYVFSALLKILSQ